MAMVGVEEVGKFANLMLHMHGLDMRTSQFGVLKFLLDLLYLFRGAMVEGVKELLKALLLRGHLDGRAQRSAIARGNNSDDEAGEMERLRSEA
jgi:hypothetical protein